MFRGSSHHKIDAKGRLIIPSRFRDAIKGDGGDGVIISRLDHCLLAFPYEAWFTIEAKILAMAEKTDIMRRFRRFFIGGASECKCDSQDRIVIPPVLREYAGLNKEITLVGVLDHFEIWDRENYENENMSMVEDMKEEEVRNVIAKIGI